MCLVSARNVPPYENDYFRSTRPSEAVTDSAGDLGGATFTAARR